MPRPFTASISTKAARRTWCPCDSRTSASPSHAPPPPRRPSSTSVWNRVTGRTRSVLAAGLRSLSPPLAAGYYTELEEVLLAADIGPAVASRLVAGVRSRAPRTRGEAIGALVAVALSSMSPLRRELFPLSIGERGLSLALFYGINGAGKTTSIGKLAHRLKQEGRKPLIVAADTYRAAGIEQMAAWAHRAEVEIFEGKTGADPASVVFDGIHAARARGSDVVLVDTAGRLQTQRNLLEELSKIGRVASKALDGAAYESLLVLDAVLGLTSLVQAREFNRVIPMTGLVLAKLDSSAKGGAGVAIDDLTAFEPEAFVRSLFED